MNEAILGGTATAARLRRRITVVLAALVLGAGVACGAPADETSSAATQSTSAAQPDPRGRIDITNKILTDRSANCAEYAAAYSATATDVQNHVTHNATVDVEVSADGSECSIMSNAVPNHDFDATGHFVTPLTEQDQGYTVTARPTAASTATPLTLLYDNAVMLNGVKVDEIAAGCYGVGDGKIGCNDINTPWRYNAMAPGNFGIDEHHAHTQSDGTYHYHGNPMALFEEAGAAAPSPVIGFAADGFPIFGSYIADGDGVRKATSSYQLRQGTRPGGPGGSYDGTFIDDYEYVAGSGDLDACNGMTQDGVYGYVVTDTYPYILGCFAGTPNDSFHKQGPR